MENIADDVNTKNRKSAQILFGIQQLHSLRCRSKHTECQQCGGNIGYLQIRPIGLYRVAVSPFRDLPRDMRQQNCHK